MQFSLLVPSRARPIQLQQLLQSLQNTIINKSQVEILIAIDNDDTILSPHLPTIFNPFPELQIKTFTRIRSDFINRDYYNYLASQAIGDYLWISADDLIYLVNGWDTRIKTQIEAHLANKPDRIICMGIKDNTPKPKSTHPPFPCFPLITKEAFKVLGFILHSEVPTWGADYLIYNLYAKINRYSAIDDEVYINHVSYHTKQVEADETNKHIGNVFNRLKMLPQHNVDLLVETLIPQQVQFLQNYIANYKG